MFLSHPAHCLTGFPTGRGGRRLRPREGEGLAQVRMELEEGLGEMAGCAAGSAGPGPSDEGGQSVGPMVLG